MTSVSLWSAKVFMSYRQKYTGIHTDFSCLDHRCLYLGGFFDGIACHLRAEDIRAFGLEILLLQSTHSNFHGKRLLFAAEAIVEFVEFSFVCGRLEASLLALVETL